MKDNKKIDLPPYWAGMIVTLVACIVMLWMLVQKADGRYPYLTPKDILFLCGIFFVRSCIYYTITDEGIQVKIFGIPIRRIFWCSLSGVALLTQWKDIGRIKKQRIVFISVFPCLPPNYNSQDIGLYSFLHPINSFVIPIPQKIETDCILIFEHNFDGFYHQDLS